MKNHLLFFFFSLFLYSTASAQNGRVGAHTNITKWTVPANSFSSASQGKQIAERIIDAIGLRTNFEIRPAAIENAAAVDYGGEPYGL